MAKEIRVKPRDTKEIEFTGNDRINKAGTKAKVHPEHAKTLMRKGFAVEPGSEYPKPTRMYGSQRPSNADQHFAPQQQQPTWMPPEQQPGAEAGNAPSVMGTGNTMNSNNQAAGDETDEGEFSL